MTMHPVNRSWSKLQKDSTITFKYLLMYWKVRFSTQKSILHPWAYTSYLRRFRPNPCP
jgi:hypothetical protein